eukprot:6186171-Pleurochrysis_carterae.AAC.1
MRSSESLSARPKMRLAAGSGSLRSLAGEVVGLRLSSRGTAANSGTSIARAIWRYASDMRMSALGSRSPSCPPRSASRIRVGPWRSVPRGGRGSS